jgi:peptidyl-prolyl cis-trans isomerase SurA
MKIFLTVLLFAGTSFSKELVDKIIASVGTEIVLASDLKAVQARAEKPGSIEETLLLGDSLDSLKKDKSVQLNFLVREKLIESEVKRLGLTVSDEQVASEMSQMAKKNNLSTAEFQAYLTNHGYSLEDYKKIMKARIERQSFFEKEIISKLRITDEDAYGVFQTRYPNYKPSVSEFKIAQIFFSNKAGGAKEAQARADAAYARLSAGEAFETIANQVDETPGANQDGVLGTFKSGEFLPEIEQATSNLPEKGVTPVLRGPNGFHIVKLLSKKTIVDPNFLKVKESIKGSLVQQNFERQLKNWFELKKIDSNVQIYEKPL